MSLVGRFTLLWSALAAGLVALFGVLSYRGSRAHLLETWQATLEHDARSAAVQIQATFDEAARDALYLAEKPSVHEFVRSGSPAERERWQRLLEADFRALLAGKPSYFQVRLIGVADDGREIIRLDNTDGRIDTAPPSRLQQKGDRDYVREGVQLAPGAVYVSDIDLNRDFGRITEPHIPTLRAVAAVRDDAGAVFGVAVVNVDARPLLAALGQLTSPGVGLELGNGRDDFLVHRDAARLHGSDLGRPDRFSQTAGNESRAPFDLEHVAECSTVDGRGPRLHLRTTAAEEQVLGGLARARNRALWMTALAALAGGVLIALSGRWLARRLRVVTEAMERYESGQQVTALSVAGADEVGRLAEKFRVMADRVRDDVEKLAAARAEAEQATKARDHFLAMMSHEIRTPMNAVIGLLRVLERNRPAPHQEPILASLRTASRQLLALLNQALDHSKIQAGKVDFEERDFALHELLEDTRLTHQPLALQKGLSLTLEAAPDLPERLRGDAVRLSQVLNNLVANAIKFTDEGSVRLTARMEAISGAGARVPIAFTVEDTGIGIAEDAIGRIFAPFDQEHGEIARRFGGTGLGLSIARSLVELQGGTLTVDSAPGRGSVFTVRLSFAPADAELPETDADAPEVPDFSAFRVLCVEDVASNREVMAATLEDTGLRLEFAADGASALALAAEGRWDAALVDLQLPDMSGVELARRLAALRPGLRMLAVTAQTSPEVREECLAAGMSGVVAKPYAAEALWAALGGVLGVPAAGEAPFVRQLARTFPGEPARVQRVLGTLAEEFPGHLGAFDEAAAAGDAAALRRLRHRLHSALSLLELHALRDALDAALATPDDTTLSAARRELAAATDRLRAHSPMVAGRSQ